MNLSEVKKMIIKNWEVEFKNKPVVLPPDCKFITGIMKNDAYLHYLENVCGIELKLSNNFRDMLDYTVIDEKKFLMFILRWT